MRSAAVAVAFLLTSGGPVLRAQPAVQPLTAGAVVLSAGKSDPVSVETLKRGLRDADPAVRITAARVATVTDGPGLANDILAALAREQRPKIAAEMIRALLVHADEAALPAVDAQLSRIGNDAFPVTAEWMARMKPDELVARLPAWVKAAGESRGWFIDPVAVAVLQHPDRREAVLRAWLAIAPTDEWSSVLNRVVTSGGAMAGIAPVLVSALGSERASIREETAWVLVRARALGFPIPPDVERALTPPAGMSLSVWEAVGRDWASRTRAPDGRGRADELAAVAKDHAYTLSDVSDLDTLSGAERELTRPTSPGPVADARPRLPPTLAPRTIELPAPPVLSSVLQDAGCELRQGQFAAAEVVFREDGRPLRIGLEVPGLPRPCQTAVAALSRLVMAPADAPIQAGASQYVLIPLIKAFAECSAAVDWDRATQETGTMNRPSGSQHIEPPKKLRHVNPRYPPAAQRARIQGVIFASALVSDTGCIPRAQILRSIPPLDLAALAAVVQWEYSPTRLDGKPVPTEMTVTLNFVLR